jgi:gluconate 2-dehydrogenase gamma chain
MKTRREALTILSTAAAIPAAAQHQHQPILQPSAPYKPKIFTPAEMKSVALLTDLIIPRTDTPGASDAHVPEFIDRKLSANGSLKDRFRLGMGRLNDRAKEDFGSPFDSLPEAKQIELLTAISAEPATALGRFFKLVKDLTIDGYYTSKEGLQKELGWNANTFVAEFKGCTHPEHQS